MEINEKSTKSKTGCRYLSDESSDNESDAEVAPYSRFLQYDDDLEISNRKFKKTLTSDLKKQDSRPKSEFLRLENLSFPSVYELAQLASKTNITLEPNESREDYERRLELRGNWKLLTSAISPKSGYFGLVYWNPNSRQTVIAHKCTALREQNQAELDHFEFELDQYLTQIESACTLSYEICKVLEELKKAGHLGLQLFFTGHSLGGGLAQITTFTAKYLTNVTTRSDVFVKRRDGIRFHSRTIVFDSPGCAGILEKLTDQLDVRYDGKTIDLKELDVSNYMLLPNMVNCCEKQIGNCFIILPSDPKGLSLSGHYHQPYDSLDTILEYLENATTRIYRVIDWPINDVRPIGDECETLFEPNLKWIGNYQPDTKGKAFIKVQKFCNGYYPIRYQIKKCNDFKCNVNVFTATEQQFLRHFQWLRSVPEYFKPQTLLDTDDQDATNNLARLKHFKMKNSIFSITKCAEDCDVRLEQLIPFVKRLLEIYPDLLKKTSDALTTAEVRKFAYKNESMEYINKLEKITKFFKSKTKFGKKVSKFLDDKETKVCRIAITKDSDIVTAQIHNIATSRDEKLNHFTMRWQNILAINQSISLKKVLTSEALPNTLLIIDFDAKEMNDDSEELFLKLVKLMKKVSNIKLIIISHEGSASNKYIQYKLESKLNDYLKNIHYNGLKWKDLVREERSLLLNMKLISFQGSEEHIKLNSIIPYGENDIVDSEYLNNLLDDETIISLIKNRVITIGNEISDLGEIAKYYVPRMLQLDFRVHASILMDTSKKDIIAISGMDVFDLEHKYGLGGENIVIFQRDTEYVERVTILSEVNAHVSFQNLIEKQCTHNRNVHWIENISNELYWRRTKGSFTLVQKYIETDDDASTKLLATLCQVSNGKSSILDESDIAGKTTTVKEFIISDKAGMGKSTVLTRLANEIKSTHPNLWVVRINLNDCTEVLKKELLKRKNKEERTFDAINFLLDQILESNPMTKFETSFQRNLFKECLLNLGGVVMMFDGFDEICPNYDEIVIEIIKNLKSTMLRNIFVTTRPQTKYQIEKALDTTSLRMRPFIRRDKEKFLIGFWSNNNSNDTDDLKKKAKSLIKAFSISVKDKLKGFSGIPLQCRMLAEVYDSYTVETLPEKISLMELYEAFVDKKLKVYEIEKCPDIKGNLNAEDSENLARKLIREYHRHLALKVLGIEKCSVLEDQSFYQDIKEILDKKSLKVGLVMRTGDNPLFVHQTFAEYFAADYFTTALIKTPISDKVICTFMKEIMLHDFDFWVVRNFINDRLINWSEYDLAVQTFGDYLVKSWVSNRQNWTNNFGNTALHTAVMIELDQLLRFFLDCSLKDEETAKKLVSFVSARNFSSSTALTSESVVPKFHSGHFQYLLTKIKKMSRDTQRQYLLANIFSSDCSQTIVNLIEKDPELGNMGAEIRSNLHLIEKFQNAAVKGNTQDLKLTLEEVNTDVRHYLITSQSQGMSALTLAIRNGHLEAATFITQQLSPDSLQLMLCKPYSNLLLAAVESGKLDMVRFVVNNFKNDRMLKDRNSAEKVIKFKRLDMLSYLLDNGFDINVKALLNGQTLLHYAVGIGAVSIVETLLQHEITVDVTDNAKRTPLHIAASNRYPTVAMTLLQYGADINAKDINGNTPLHHLALSWPATPRIASLLIEHGAKVDCKNADKLTPFYLAMDRGNTAGLIALAPLQPRLTTLSIKTRKWLRTDSLPTILTKVEMDYFNVEPNPPLTDVSIEEEVTRSELMLKEDVLGSLIFTDVIYCYYFVADYFLDELRNILSNENYLENFIKVFLKEEFKETRTILIRMLMDKTELKTQIGQDIIVLVCEYWFRTPPTVFKRNKDMIWKKLDSFEREEIVGLILQCLTDESMNEFIMPCLSALELEITLTVNTAIETENEHLLDNFMNFVNACSVNIRQIIMPSILSGDKNRETVEYLLKKIENYPSLMDIFKDLFQRKIRVLKFFEASESGSLDVLRLMLNEARDSEARNVLFLALRETTDFQNDLIMHRCYYRPLNLAVKNGHYQTVQFLIDNEVPINPPVAPQNQDVFEMSDCVVPPLFNAIKLRNLEMTELLLENGADINAKVGRLSVVKLAVKCQFIEFCQFLLSWKYKEKGVDKSGALHIALIEGYSDIAQILLDSGVDVNERNELGRTPLSSAVTNSEIPESLIKTMLEKGANVNAAGKDGKTPLHFAIQNEITVKIFLTLVENGADINAPDREGQTPLFWAAKMGTLEMVRTILANGGLVNTRDIAGDTPLHFAAMEGREEVVMVLLEAGASPDYRNSGNETPLDTAETFGRAKVVDMLLKYEKTD